MLLYTLKNKKFKKTWKNLFEARFYCFLGVFWMGFLMPTLLVNAQPIPYLRPNKSK